LKSYTQYLECPACGQVVYDPRLKLAKVDEPAPCCGASGKSRGVWPSREAHKFLEIIDDQDFNSAEGCRIATVFLCAVMELLLENSLWKLLEIHTKSEQLAEFVLDKNRGKPNRIGVYNEFSDVKLKDLFQSRGMTTFYDDWESLYKLRSKIVHGRYFSSSTNDADLIRKVRENCLKAFVEIHNDVQRMLRLNATKV
jgi:hypothetical protein